MSSQPAAVPPRPHRRPEESTFHGDTRIEQYGWLAAADDPEVLAHLAAENEYAAALTADEADLRATIFDEIVARTVTDDVSVPARLGGWWYFTRSRDGAQYPVCARCPVTAPDDWTPPTVGDDPVAGEQVMLDGNAEAVGAPFFALGAVAVSPDENLLGYSVDLAGDERFTVRVKDLRTGELLADEIAGTFYGLTWSADSGSLYYTVVDDAWRPFELRRHALGTPASEDVVLLREDDERFWLGVDLSTSRRYLLYGVGSKTTSEYHVLDLTDPDATPQLVAARRDGVEYDIDHVVVDGRDALVIVHNGTVVHEGKPVEATDFAVSLAQIGDSDPAHWQLLVPPEPGVRMLGATAMTRGIIVSLRRAGVATVAVLPVLPAGACEEAAGPVPGIGPLRDVAFGEELFTADTGHILDPNSPFARLSYTSFVTPPTTLDLDLVSGELVRRKQLQVREVAGVRPADFTEERVWAVADDGTRIPISLVYRRGLRPDGRNPVLLYGYGSYESSMDANFTAARLSLLQRDVVYAVAHVRGGGELGRAWYDDGHLDKKKNSFTDFVACARHLVDSGWADPTRLVALGGSAGGLLMGAVANLAPTTFAGILAQVPFVDALSTMLDPSLPLTVIEREEWGDPIADPEAYAYLKSYSPYEQVADLPYPPILAITSLHDTRVRYVEPAKWIARLRELAPDGGPYLLKTELDGGHGGGSGRYTAWHDRAYEYAWILARLGLNLDAGLNPPESTQTQARTSAAESAP